MNKERAAGPICKASADEILGERDPLGHVQGRRRNFLQIQFSHKICSEFDDGVTAWMSRSAEERAAGPIFRASADEILASARLGLWGLHLCSDGSGVRKQLVNARKVRLRYVQEFQSCKDHSRGVWTEVLASLIWFVRS